MESSNAYGTLCRKEHRVVAVVHGENCLPCGIKCRHHVCKFVCSVFGQTCHGYKCSTRRSFSSRHLLLYFGHYCKLDCCLEEGAWI